MFFLRRRNRELDEEIRAHLAIEKRERMERGETAGEAEENARRAFGNELLIKEVTREMWGWAVLDVRVAGDPDSIAASVRKTIHAVAPDLPIERVTPLALQVERSLSPERMGSVVTAAFGTLALGLACFGLYGVMSYAVTRRTQEIGVRMALGARPRNVLWAVLQEALALIAMGLAAGLPVVILASRSIAALLYGVRPDDPQTLIATVAILTIVAVCAAAWPAWRASRISPLAALRYE